LEEHTKPALSFQPSFLCEDMSDKMAFLLFGDQSLDVYAFLADFCGGSKIPSVLARSFLEQVGAALRREVDQLSSIERQRVPRFASVKELNENYHSHEVKNSAVDSALLCIAQLAHYIE
jgi:iron transport multicopper oxidase